MCREQSEKGWSGVLNWGYRRAAQLECGPDWLGQQAALKLEGLLETCKELVEQLFAG